jgi:hypothetical protein
LEGGNYLELVLHLKRIIGSQSRRGSAVSLWKILGSVEKIFIQCLSLVAIFLAPLRLRRFG